MGQVRLRRLDARRARKGCEVNLPQSSIIDQIADERDELRQENQWLNRRIELLVSANSDVARIAKERDDALMMLGLYRMISDEQKERIKTLEDIINQARMAFFSDGTDKSAAADMLFVLNQSKESKP